MVATATSRVPEAARQTVEAPAAESLSIDEMIDQVLTATEKAVGRIRLTEEGGIEFDSFEGVQRYARMLCAAGCVPTVKDDSQQAQLARATMAILLGRQVGLPPDQAVASIYVVNCRPVIFGDAPLAICRQHPAWDESGFSEWYEVGGKRIEGEPDPEAFKRDDTAACCSTLRKGAKAPKIARFSMAHAKAAGLLSRNAQLYGGYPQRMTRFRARGYCLRDNFGDALKGIGIRELADEETHPEAQVEAPPVGRQSLKKNGTHQAATPAAEPTPAPAKPEREPEPAPVEQPEAVQSAPAPAPDPEQLDQDAACLTDMVEHLDGRIDAAETGAELAKVLAEIEGAAWMGDEARNPLRAKLKARQQELQPAAPVAAGSKRTKF